ncbi:MAG: alpha/beta hydrolase [Planctomycetia bacterium]|nr:alpha/beta hydrolase [Planctomycetia bacterium]
MPEASTVAASPPSRSRRLRDWLIRAGVIYVGVCIVLLLLENKLLYQPFKDTDHWQPPPAGLTVEDVWVQTPDGTRIHGWYFPKEGATGALVYCHGNALNLSHRGGAVRELMDALGESVLLFDYPGYGKSDGSPSEAGCYAAGDAVCDWLTQTKQVPGERLILFGKSLGGGIATDLASRRPHRALVLVKAFTSFPDIAQSQVWFMPARYLVRNKYDNVEKLAKCQRPVAVAAGDCDTLIPWWMGEKLYATANEPKWFYRMAGCGHNDALPPDFLTGLADFLKRTAP